MPDFSESFDAKVWAKAFIDAVRTNPDIATDEATMTGWFANAIMRGFDESNRRFGSDLMDEEEAIET